MECSVDQFRSAGLVREHDEAVWLDLAGEANVTAAARSAVGRLYVTNHRLAWMGATTGHLRVERVTSLRVYGDAQVEMSWEWESDGGSVIWQVAGSRHRQRSRAAASLIAHTVMMRWLDLASDLLTDTERERLRRQTVSGPDIAASQSGPHWTLGVKPAARRALYDRLRTFRGVGA